MPQMSMGTPLCIMQPSKVIRKWSGCCWPHEPTRWLLMRMQLQQQDDTTAVEDSTLRRTAESRQRRLEAANNEFSTLQQVRQVLQQEATKGALRRKVTRITSSLIGNASKLPQLIRNSINRSLSDDMNSTLIDEEEKDNLTLFKEIDSLSSCCCRSDSTTNCIKKHFIAKGSAHFDFVEFCSFIRR
mmetsp:Transcript_26643/g.38097  ORF Transcript_26643/g.38097 Transcript_26643/m.38097 type:complete len:186 (-) Transcript_26643:1563-2120(-)